MIWGCDTCPGFVQGDYCEFEFEHTIKHGEQLFVRAIRKCSSHNHLEDSVAHAFVLADNKQKAIIKSQIKVD